MSNRRVLAVRLVGLAIAVAAIWFCVDAIRDSWPEVRDSVAHAQWAWVAGALVASAASMAGLGLLWWRCLRTFGVRTRVGAAIAWHFGGELAKYLPGGVWAVLGRGELAYRGGGVPRSTGYATTLISYACMSVAAAIVCGVLGPLSAIGAGGLGWGWWLLVLIPLGLAVVQPAVLGPLLAAGRRLTGQRLDLEAPPGPAMLRLIGWAGPSWLLLGAAAVMVTEALGFDQEPLRIAFSAVAAWMIGFLAVPVPAGVGVREVVFVALSGLDAGPATAVAAVARLLLLIVDGVGGTIGLAATGVLRGSR